MEEGDWEPAGKGHVSMTPAGVSGPFGRRRRRSARRDTRGIGDRDRQTSPPFRERSLLSSRRRSGRAGLVRGAEKYPWNLIRLAPA